MMTALDGADKVSESNPARGRCPLPAGVGHRWSIAGAS
jgi:hypothetical protein